MLRRMVVSPRHRSVLYALIATGACFVFTRFVDAAGPSESQWRLRIPAAEFDRLAQAVRVDAPAAGLPKRWLDRESGKSFDLQALPDGTGLLVIPELEAGRSLLLQPLAGGRAVDGARSEVWARETPGGLVVGVDAREVLAYATAARVPEGVDPVFTRAAFIHPVYTPDGIRVTDAFPADHPHQNGIWTAWTDTTHRGHALDFWNLRKRQGRVEFLEIDDTFHGPVAGGFSSRMAATDITGETPLTVLDERWRVTVYSVSGVDANVFDIDIAQTNVSDAPLQLNTYRYGGFAFRGHEQWIGATNTHFLTSEGETDRVKAHATRMRWCHVGGHVGDALAGAAILGHPGNFRAPQPARVSPGEPFFCFAPVQLGPFEIAPGGEHRMRFRVVVARGAPDRARLDAFWNGYAHPAEAELVGAE